MSTLYHTLHWTRFAELATISVDRRDTIGVVKYLGHGVDTSGIHCSLQSSQYWFECFNVESMLCEMALALEISNIYHM